ncbi:unnamed protein product [Macrosiphum euphorbiae]|uniref:Uncharacterized protein n=1 Tax=Macrosiphum euphorbiae TaxID=13131 RepID=A0AAV0WRL7_9HEMI|nr:unnamed protein product [Macrosiphum euphorbiae]
MRTTTSSSKFVLTKSAFNGLCKEYLKKTLMLLKEQNEMEVKGSVFSLESIDIIIFNVNVYKPFGGSSYLPLPAFIERKKATINARNFDEKCFKYTMLAKLVNPVHAERIGSNYVEVENRYDFKNINSPASLNDVVKFEKTNKVSVNIYYSLKNGELKYKNNVKKIQKE